MGVEHYHCILSESLGEEIPNRKSGMDGVSQIVYSSRKQAVRETQIASKTKASGTGRVCRMDSHIQAVYSSSDSSSSLSAFSSHWRKGSAALRTFLLVESST